MFLNKNINILPLPLFGAERGWGIETECIKLREEVTELQAEARSIARGEGDVENFWSEWWDCAQVLANIYDAMIEGYCDGSNSGYWFAHNGHMEKMRKRGFITNDRDGDCGA